MKASTGKCLKAKVHNLITAGATKAKPFSLSATNVVEIAERAWGYLQIRCGGGGQKCEADDLVAYKMGKANFLSEVGPCISTWR